MLLNNLFGLLPCAFLLLLPYGEAAKWGDAFSALTSMHWLLIVISCLNGLAISYAGLRVQQLVTATTFMVLTNVNKFVGARAVAGWPHTMRCAPASARRPRRTARRAILPRRPSLRNVSWLRASSDPLRCRRASRPSHATERHRHDDGDGRWPLVRPGARTHLGRRAGRCRRQGEAAARRGAAARCAEPPSELVPSVPPIPARRGAIVCRNPAHPPPVCCRPPSASCRCS